MSALMAQGHVEVEVDLRVEVAAMQARLDVLRGMVSAAQRASSPALLGRDWVLQIANVVSQEFGVTIDELMGSLRTAKHVRPRQVWVWLVRTAGGYSNGQTARMTGYVEASMVYHCCNRVEHFRGHDSYFEMVTDQLLLIARAVRQECFAAAKARAAKRAEDQAAEALAGPEGLL